MSLCAFRESPAGGWDKHPWTCCCLLRPQTPLLPAPSGDPSVPPCVSASQGLRLGQGACADARSPVSQVRVCRGSRGLQAAVSKHGQAVPPGSCRCRRMCHSGGSLQGRPQSEDPRDRIGACAPWPQADCPARPPHIQPCHSLAVRPKHLHKLPEPPSSPEGRLAGALLMQGPPYAFPQSPHLI